MLTIGDQDAVNLLRYFDDLPDPRSDVNRLHRLGDVIVIAICAVIATADGPTAIAHWAKLNEVWLKKHLSLPNGIPGKDTFRRSPDIAQSHRVPTVLSGLAEFVERPHRGGGISGQETYRD